MNAERDLTTRDHLRMGVQNQYPPCCVARFVVTNWLRPDVAQAKRRGVIRQGQRYWVPCLILHRSAPVNCDHDDCTPVWCMYPEDEDVDECEHRNVTPHWAGILGWRFYCDACGVRVPDDALDR